MNTWAHGIAIGLQVIALGSGLTPGQRQQMVAYLATSHGPSVITTVFLHPGEGRFMGCASLETTERDGGLSVHVYHITQVRAPMYRAVLETAGMNKGSVVIAAPYGIPGIHVLPALWAAARLAHEPVNPHVQHDAQEELAVMSQLTHHGHDAAGVVRLVTVLTQLAKRTPNLSAPQRAAEVERLARQCQVSATAVQRQQLADAIWQTIRDQQA
ncbi:MAG: DUF1002 domain-containing protein [Sulfobacillus thermotolerans]|uniref:ANTAR domain-containing protein n=1 Tax=Sulfobacillus thermotolerans TaxID=338644 RepID=A0ABM6RNH4_9FIRM|nr:hypothetical protein BXT84_02195 [Sulfobacillus thermotolerans]MCY0907180.1 DUF1002 domain-containing protein [Sulfobacillus thermotolerans]